MVQAKNTSLRGKSEADAVPFTSFYIVRHGETDWNLQDKMHGHQDIPLNQNGEMQAHALHEKLKCITFDAVFSSDLIRAHRTAEIIVKHTGHSINRHVELRERTFGPFEGYTSVQLREAYRKYTLRQEVSIDDPYAEKWHPEIESSGEIRERVSKFLINVAKQFPERNLLVVAHGGILHALLAKFEEFVYGKSPFKVHNCAYIKVNVTPNLPLEKAKLSEWEGIDTLHH